MAKTKNSSKIIAILSAIILFLSLAFVIIPNLDNSTSTQVQASTLTEAQLQQRRNAPGLYQTGTTTLKKSWTQLIAGGDIVVDNPNPEDNGYASEDTNDRITALGSILSQAGFGDEGGLYLATAIFNTSINQIVAPSTALLSSMVIALPGESPFYTLSEGMIGEEEQYCLMGGENLILQKNSPATGVATDLFSFMVTGIIIIALVVVCVKKRKLSK